MGKDLNDFYDYLSNDSRYCNKINKIFAGIRILERTNFTNGLEYDESVLLENDRYEAIEALLDFSESFRQTTDPVRHLYKPSDKNQWAKELFERVLANSSSSDVVDNLEHLSKIMISDQWLSKNKNTLNWAIVVFDDGDVDLNPVSLYVKGITGDQSNLRTDVGLVYELGEE